VSLVPKLSKSQSKVIFTLFFATLSLSIAIHSVLPWLFSHSSGCLFLDSLLSLDEGHSGYLDFILYGFLGWECMIEHHMFA